MVILSFLSQTGLMYSHIGRMFLVNFGLIIQRIEQVMNIAEVACNNIEQERYGGSEGLVFKGFTAYWNKEAKIPCLKDINLALKSRTLTTVIGKIGSGKTTLLLSVLKEIPVTQGKLEFSGRVAFVEQEPIIFSGTFRENVLFGKEYNAELFNEVIKICSLDKDLALFPYKDLTLIGEKGVNLTGGQKARVSLARAIYSESDIYLLDDPFSAVDSKVARDMFENGLKGGILRNKTVILVTHHLHFAKESDYVVVMDHGRIQAQGSFSEIEHMDVDLLNIFNQNNSRRNRVASDLSEEEILKKKKMSIYNNNKGNEVQNAEENINEDSTSVSWSTYKKYMKVIGTYKELLLLTGLFGGFQIITIYYTRYIGYWALQHSLWDHQQEEEFDHSGYIMSSGVLLGMMYVLNYFKRMKYYEYILGINSGLHKRMMRKLTRAKVLFFDVNPIGRILNRFANDLGILDKPNIISSYDLIDGVLYSFSLLFTICLINPSLFISLGVVIYLLTRMKKYFERPMVLSKKRELVSRSPIFSIVSSTLNGLMIIRVYNRGGKFIREFLDLIYEKFKALLFMHKTSFFFGIALDIGIRGIMIIGIMTFAYLVFYIGFESALIGLSLLFLLQIGEETSYVVKQTLSVDINMQRTQRMLEYCELPSEGKENVGPKDQKVEEQFQGKWTTRGELIFHDVYLRYREDLPCALNGLSFKVPGRTKVVCVGRTGAGKSSIIQALFRMMEIEDGPGDYESYIKIDGVDIKEIGLNLLRKRLSIIPQAPVVFTGTIKRNLDPFELYKDEEIWSVLEEVSLKRMVMGLEKGLETDMTVSSSVFSVGQKQLICLARAILMKSKVLILDEATANVDMETDEFIQRKIMEFAECTVLTIAHRLTTIANYDKVIVMDKGRMVEFDSPYELLVEKVGDERISRKDGGVFVDMVKNTGNKMAKKIFKLAREHEYSKKEKTE